MSKEEDVANILRNDTILMALLTGGVLTDEVVGVEGIRRSLEPEDLNPTKDVFDADGVLQPCAVVRQGGETLYQNINLVEDKMQAVSRRIQIYFYQFRQHDVITAAMDRVFYLLMGTRLPGTYPMWRTGESPAYPDVGPVQNSTSMIQDWIVVYMKRSA